MQNRSAGHRSWRRTAIVVVALPLVIALAVLAYAWPASRIAPRDLPVGVVGANPAGQHAIEGLERSKPGGFDFHLYSDEAAARSAVKNREVYGAFVVTAGRVTVLEATAASTPVAQLLTTAGQQLAAHAGKLPVVNTTPSAGTSHRTATGKGAGKSAAASRKPAPVTSADKAVAKVSVDTVDVVPTSADDPRGVVFSSALLPLTICSILIAALVALSGVPTPGWRRLIDLVVGCAVTGFAAYLVAQGVLGALPDQPVATWAALSLTLLAISATTAGVITLIGPSGLGLSAALMVFLGNPFSGITSAPELLPKAVGDIGQWLPPGAGANLLRSTAYFGGNGAEGHVAVLVLWSVLGLAAVVLGRRRTATVPNAGPDSPSVAVTAIPLSPESRPHSHARHADLA
ncbi:ABC transporter permease [Streptomyces adustus]|uniref:ABC transporter permease n=1 Tax=Streptomyces adustus TaxID=1609272 RepID=UPI003716FF58